jgi:predicted DNA repair protein MutK
MKASRSWRTSFCTAPRGRGAPRRSWCDAVADPTVDLAAVEKQKIRGAIRTDLILSAEIIVITLGTVAAGAVQTQVSVLVGIAP